MKEKFKNLNIVLLSLIFILTGVKTFADKLDLNMNIIVRGSYLKMDEDFVLEDGETYIPIRPIANKLGVEIDYLDDEYSILLKNGEVLMKNKIGSDTLMVGDKEIDLVGKTFMHKKKTYFPVESLGKILGDKVTFDVKNQTIVFGEFQGNDNFENTYSYTNEADGYTINVPSKYKDNLLLREDGLYIKDKGKDYIRLYKSDKASLNEEDIILNYESGNYIQASLVDRTLSYDDFLKIIGTFRKLEGHNYFYENEKFGFRLYMPLTWDGRYEIKESEDGVAFFHKSLDKKNPNGFLFGIERRIGDLISEEDIDASPMPQKLLMKSSGYTFVETSPSGLEYDPSDEKDTVSYEEMRKEIEIITASIKPYKAIKAKAKNENYKLLGSNFFTVEIPNNMSLSKNATNNFLWDLKKDDKLVGGLELVSFSSSFSDELYDYAFIEDKDKTRRIKFFIKKDSIERGSFEKIKNSLQIKIYNSNTMDDITDLEAHLKNGGKELSGVVEKYETKGKDVVSLTVKGRKYDVFYPRVIPLVDDQYPLYSYKIFNKDYADGLSNISKIGYRIILNEKNQVVGLIEAKKG